MKDQIDCATIFHLAADKHKSEQRLVQAIQLYKKACEAYRRGGDYMVTSVGLAYIGISECLSELGELELSEEYFMKAREIIRRKANLEESSIRRN